MNRQIRAIKLFFVAHAQSDSRLEHAIDDKASGKGPANAQRRA